MKNTKNQVMIAVVLVALFTLGSSTVFAETNSSSTCPVVTKFLRLGEKNDKSEVTKLQVFLKNTEKMDVDVSGIFDTKTEEAVKVFQKKYSDIILAPWGATKASGIVHITTAKQINKIACATPLTLSDSDIKALVEYKNRPKSDVTIVDLASSSSTMLTSKKNSNASSSEDNIAAVGGSSVAGKFLSFLRGLFR